MLSLSVLIARASGQPAFWRHTDFQDPFDIIIRCSDQEHLRCVTHRGCRVMMCAIGWRSKGEVG
jgi:hypothetical protein